MESAKAPVKILVIDDEPAIRKLLTRVLTAEGYAVDTAEDGLEALDKLGREKYHVALCDLNMPKLGGMETLDEIRKRELEVEVIIVTGYATIETAVTAMKNGAYGFVQKPFHLEEVLALVQKSIEKSDLKSVIQQLRAAKKKVEFAQTLLVQSEKLAGVGLLAAGVAHEINNPLGGILGLAQLLLDDPSLSPQQRTDVEKIAGLSQRCRVIIQNLLQFSRSKDPVSEAVDLKPLLLSTLDLVRNDFFTHGMKITEQLSAELPRVFGDPNQLQQVFLNLIINARQAMEPEKKGEILVTAETLGDRVQLHFKDTGPGIPAENLGKIFDPFFTTKPVGQGTGLGLSICYGIVQQHHGDLRVESPPGAGATFTIDLPVQRGQVSTSDISGRSS